MIWDFSKVISRRLMLWTVLSILIGLGMLLLGNPICRGFGIQALVWGAVDGLIAWFGLRRIRKNSQKPPSFAEEEKETARIRKILWINGALDVVYMSAGAALVIILGPESPFWRGTGWGIIVQGAFLFFFDTVHALRAPDPLQMPHLPLFTHPDHEPFLFEGGSPAAILVHGFPGTALEMRPLGHELYDAGWTVSGLRLPGFGAELCQLIHYENRDWVNTIVEGCQALRDRGHHPLLLVGYSFGGALALQAAAQVQVTGLVLIAPFVWREPPWGRLLGDAFRSLLPLSVHPFRRLPINKQDLAKQYQAYLPEIDLEDPAHLDELDHLQFPLAILDQLRAVGRSGLNAAPQVQTPTLMINSMRDPIIQPRSIDYLQTQLAGPVTRERVNGPHGLTMPQNPAFKAVAEKTLAFAAQILQAKLTGQ
jgi:carboxylesterase